MKETGSRRPTQEERRKLITTISSGIDFRRLKDLFPDLGVRRLAGYWRKYSKKGASMEDFTNQKEVNMPDINTEKLLEDVKKISQEAIKAYFEEMRQKEEQKAREKRVEDTIGEVAKIRETVTGLSQQIRELRDNTKTVCELFPQLCKDRDELKTKVSDLEKKIVAPEAKPEAKPKAEPKRGIGGTSHTTLDELIACPECKPEGKVKFFLDLMKKVGPEKAAIQICRDDEVCKAFLAELVKKGYRVEEPKKEEFRSAFNLCVPPKSN